MFIPNPQAELFIITSSLVARTDPSYTSSTQISGFYGPGAWAAWIITLVASWISLFQVDSTHNLHFIGYSLYMNWAAIDLISQFSQAARDRDHLNIDQARLENITASLAILSIGICHAVAQTALVWRLHSYTLGSDFSPSLRRRLLVLILGLLIPLSAAWWCELIPLVRIKAWLIGSSLLGHLFLACSVCDLIGVKGAKDYSVVCILIMALLSLPMICTLDTLRNKELTIIFIGDIQPPRRCSIVPCAPQGIGEWDQAFSLLIALVPFFYEFGSGMVYAVKKGIQAIYRT